jgi:hypothetical protein
MKTLLATLVLALIPQDMPQDAQKIISQADQKLEALRKSYEESCAKVKAQELKDLQRIHDAIEKGNPAGATAIKTKIDVLAADVSVAMKPPSTVEQWLQGKWIIMFQGSGDVMEFKEGKLIGSGIGDRTKGRYTIDASTVQLIWDSGYVETMKLPKVFADEVPGLGRNGAEAFKRLK